MNKYVLSGLAAILFSPVLFEIPVLWRWAEVTASERFLTDNSTKQISTLSQESSIHVYGLQGCGYSKALRNTLDKWGFDYVYHDIGSWQESRTTAPEMWEVVKRANPTEQWSLPVVEVNKTAVVGQGTNIDDVAKVLAEQGKLPLQYVPIRVGLRMAFILFTEVVLVFYMYLIYILFAIGRKALSSKRIS